MNNAPIGVFDSGLGGLTVWSELYRKLPHESLIYYGDGKNCPYGDKSREELIAHVDPVVKFLIGKGVKMIVIACNAATAMTIEYLRQHYSLPFIGLEPAVKPAALNSKSGVIGILATAATLKGELFKNSSQRFSQQVKILTQVGEGFVELVESNREMTPEAVVQVRKLLVPLLDAGADQIVLGCTHYPFLAETMRQVIGERDVALVNPASAIERQTEALLKQFDIQAEAGHVPHYAFYTSADEEYLQKLIDKSETVRSSNFG